MKIRQNGEMITYRNGYYILFVFAVVSKPSDCIFPYDFKDAVRKKVSGHVVMELSLMVLVFCTKTGKSFTKFSQM